MTHRDVVLVFFSNRKKEVLSLVGGDPLNYSDDYLINPRTGKRVAKLSVKMRDNLRQWEERGYRVTSASVRFVVAWREKDSDKGTTQRISRQT